MKTGITRRVDDLGRIVLPVELRKNKDINPGDHLEIEVQGNSIILTKFVTRCVLCDSQAELIDVDGHGICSDCIRKIQGRRLP